ncbi:hypothetical protein [Duganella callida]|uniref:DUF2158 domain-containing protein n=1 Tax=Duganella callida TaxID=2561932 RepID=A0A4Y9S3K8_9BURK|nr:hypothetical protein [Duganella callida]TFW15982.1 hypothetical protein E4L98_25140 [Duganella callida]
MSDELEEGRPIEGSLVRFISYADGPIMTVLNSALGEQHDWEGVRNGILCRWYVEGEEEYEVFRPGQLSIVKLKTGDADEAP